MRFIIFLLITLIQLAFIFLPRAQAATTKVDLLTADNFAVLAGSAVVDANISIVTGDLGVSPSSGTFIGIPCSEVTGTIYSVDGAGPLPCRVTNPGLLTQAKNDLTTAYTDASNRTPATTLPGGDNQLGGQTLTSGVYAFGHASTANLTGTLTLDAEDDPTAVFILQASSDFITASSSVVSLINGAQACNVFWQVSTSATFGTGSNFAGTVMADQSITDNGGSTVNGRFLARIAAVTLDDTQITKPTCATSGSTSNSASSSASSISSASSASSGESVCVSSGVTTVPSILEARRVSPTSIFVSWGPDAGLNDFIVQYGFENGTWLFNTKVSGFSTTINDLPANQSIWVHIAATDNCAIGSYGTPVLVGGTTRTNSPGFPNTGFAPHTNNVQLNIAIIAGIISLASGLFIIKKRNLV